ncbi:MucR family transcriptional regulator [Methylobacterium sp. J-072]|uniref:MucR family transcriptional regulator n=1 Tax=Methylobacterium sp. J-072 TaxID=2836651 RepID=UPI001FBAEDF9|nr:MucR family transcriptional regulator [Methylobacterium sp. J-072]MCJ2094397.1 MucR family transcriptional regulator [Methylobacterium sp. J-072]
MIEDIQNVGSNLAELTGEIVSAYVTKNSVPAVELPKLIESIHTALNALKPGGRVPASEVEKPSDAQIRKSIRPDGIVSFIDGKTYKTLKRHLTSRGLDPRGYREQYGLPADYPMVAPSYAEKRSALAKAIGLGRPNGQAERQLRKRKAA